MNNELDKKMEAVLFLSADSVTNERIAKLLEIKKEEVSVTAKKLKQRLEADSGLTLVSDGQSWQLVTKKELNSFAEQITKEELGEELSPALLETLAVIAYKGPISKVGVEHLRGVNSGFSLRKLLIRGLIQSEGELYKASVDFIKKLGLNEQNQLPEYERFNKLEYE